MKIRRPNIRVPLRGKVVGYECNVDNYSQVVGRDHMGPVFAFPFGELDFHFEKIVFTTQVYS